MKLPMKNKQVFIINGMGGSGKDTFVDCIKRISENKIINYSSVDLIKKAAKILGWSGVKEERDRKFLADLKNLCTKYNDLPFISLKEVVGHFNKLPVEHTEMLFLHIREPKEIERAKKEFEAKTIFVNRPNIKKITSNSADSNVYNYQYDITIQNNSDLDLLFKKAQKFYDDYTNRFLNEMY